MARCQCAGSSCSCQIVGGTGVNIAGTGSANQPYTIESVPNVYDVTMGPGSPSFYINAQFTSEVESRALFMVEMADAYTGTIMLPDGSSAYPRPVRGAMIDVIVNGTLGGSSGVSFGGAVVTWFGPAPTTSTLGWYRFLWNGLTFSGTWTPYR